jgi:hypothetical protein
MWISLSADAGSNFEADEQLNLILAKYGIFAQQCK